MWGHAIHGMTFAEAPPPEPPRQSLLAKLFPRKGAPKAPPARRYGVMVHTSGNPEMGDLIRYRAEGGVCEGIIYRVKPCWNPRDMFTLFFEVVEPRP